MNYKDAIYHLRMFEKQSNWVKPEIRNALNVAIGCLVMADQDNKKMDEITQDKQHETAEEQQGR